MQYKILNQKCNSNCFILKLLLILILFIWQSTKNESVYPGDADRDEDKGTCSGWAGFHSFIYLFTLRGSLHGYRSSQWQQDKSHQLHNYTLIILNPSQLLILSKTNHNE
jgi:hypothetical protein